MNSSPSGETSKTGSAEELSQPIDPSLRELYLYWLDKKGSRIAPPRSEIQPRQMRWMLGKLALIEVIGVPARFRFQLFGTDLTHAYGQDLTGKFLDEVDLDLIGPTISSQAEKVLRECRVHVGRDRFTRKNGRHVEYERIALPLSSDGRTVNMVLVGFNIERAYGPKD